MQILEESNESVSMEIRTKNQFIDVNADMFQTTLTHLIHIDKSKSM